MLLIWLLKSIYKLVRTDEWGGVSNWPFPPHFQQQSKTGVSLILNVINNSWKRKKGQLNSLEKRNLTEKKKKEEHRHAGVVAKFQELRIDGKTSLGIIVQMLGGSPESIYMSLRNLLRETELILEKGIKLNTRN